MFKKNGSKQFKCKLIFSKCFQRKKIKKTVIWGGKKSFIKTQAHFVNWKKNVNNLRTVKWFKNHRVIFQFHSIMISRSKPQFSAILFSCHTNFVAKNHKHIWSSFGRLFPDRPNSNYDLPIFTDVSKNQIEKFICGAQSLTTNYMGFRFFFYGKLLCSSHCNMLTNVCMYNVTGETRKKKLRCEINWS